MQNNNYNSNCNTDYSRQESRLNERQTVFIETQSAYKGDPDNYKMLVCQSIDISANGIRAHIDQPVPLNAIYQICIELHSSGKRMYLAAQVKWIRPEESSEGYQVGFQIFESEDTDIEAWKIHVADCLTALC